MTRPGGGYRLRETDGLVLAFRPDGLLDFAEEANGNRTIVRNNTFAGDATDQVAIRVQSNSDQVVIENNRVELTGGGQPIAVSLINTGGAVLGGVGGRIRDNILNAGSTGIGISVTIVATGPDLAAQIEGNDFHGNLVGVDIGGTGGLLANAGAIDLGGGSMPWE